MALIAGIVIIMWVNSAVNSAGPVTETAIVQKIGNDVPRYPNSAFEPGITRAVVISFAVAEKLAGKPTGGIFRGAGAWVTADDPTKVIQYYEKQLPKSGWTKARENERSGRQQGVYRKGSEMLVIQAQEQPNGTMITIMRGGPEIVKQAPKVR